MDIASSRHFRVVQALRCRPYLYGLKACESEMSTSPGIRYLLPAEIAQFASFAGWFLRTDFRLA